MSFILVFSLVLLAASCSENKANNSMTGYNVNTIQDNDDIIVGAENIATYYNDLKGKKVGMVVNQTSRVGSAHLVDSLLELGIDIVTIFAPEHGFRGMADAGEHVKNGIDTKTGVPLISLYGKKKKPQTEDIKNIDIMVFDIQDVGARFYTYISSLHYVMEACAEHNIPLIVLDRPNPNAHYIDGPILEKEFSSFVGMHQVPIVYGMTIGEYAKMINGEKWLNNEVETDLTVVPCNNYTHDAFYELPVKPSPNLPNIRSIYLYPSLCLFEGSTVSVGRGTDTQFQVVGHPTYSNNTFQFTPVSKPGAKHPKHMDKLCNGIDLTKLTTGYLHDRNTIDLSYILQFHKDLSKSNRAFFNKNNFFEKLAGTSKLRTQILEGKTEDEIRKTWKNGIEQFKKTRSKYLIYK